MKRALLASASVVAAIAASAETRPTLNFYGATGLIDMPSAEMQKDGAVSISTAHFGPISRTTLSFQITPRMSGSFRYTGVRDWNAQFCPPDCTGANEYDTYYDRAFDLRYQLVEEGRYRPAVTVGFQDFVGTGLQSGEYIVATKHIVPSVKVTAGIGWGRLGSYGPIGAPFGERPRIEIGEGGNFNFGQFFRGDAAPFAGVEWQVNENWGLKAEYSSDAYEEEAGLRGTFDRRSPFNFGVEYQRNNTLRLGAYYLYGSEVGLAAHFVLDPQRRAMGAIRDSAPEPVEPRPARAADPEAWGQEWVTQDGGGEILLRNLNRRLEGQGIVAEAIGYTGTTATVRIRNIRYDAEAQAIGRTARAMANVLPPSVETFDIVPVVNGMPVSTVRLARSDVERLEFSPDAADALRDRVSIRPAMAAGDRLTFNREFYPQFNWALSPYARARLFDLDSPFKIDLGLRLSARFEPRPGFVLSGAVSKRLGGNLDDPPPDIPTGLQPVRSDVDRYDALGDPALESLTAAWYGRLGPDVYGRVTLGYLERMFGGASAEVLWKPGDRRWALGAEVNYVAQRDADQGFGFGEYDYRVATGHVSGYFDLGKGYQAQLDVGRYLAGDMGATLTLSREFSNGWKVGAFATKTNVSAEDFGSGSFDKGIVLEVPLTWLTGKPSRQTRTTVLRPFGRDGGARLEVEGRLYDTVRDYQKAGIDEQWGRFWK